MTRTIRMTRCIAQPIETGLTGLGVPDLFVRTHKVGAWCELKNIKERPTFPFKVPFRPGQYMWLKRHAVLGGTSILGIGTPIGIYFFCNDAIREVYYKSFEELCAYKTLHFNAREFVNWLNEL
jgi:hypothetical protein